MLLLTLIRELKGFLDPLGTVTLIQPCELTSKLLDVSSGRKLLFVQQIGEKVNLL